MPWHIAREGAKYFVVTTSTGRKHSKEGLSHKKAVAQLAALHINADAKKKPSRE